MRSYLMNSLGWRINSFFRDISMHKHDFYFWYLVLECRTFSAKDNRQKYFYLRSQYFFHCRESAGILAYNLSKLLIPNNVEMPVSSLDFHNICGNTLLVDKFSFVVEGGTCGKVQLLHIRQLLILNWYTAGILGRLAFKSVDRICNKLDIGLWFHFLKM